MSLKLKWRCIPIATAGWLLAGSAWGTGFDQYETSAHGAAMGGAIVGLSDDASCVYNNPANMVNLPGIQTLAGVTVLRPSVTQDLGVNGQYTIDRQTFLLPHAYVTWQINDRWWFGMAEYTRFGLGTRYNASWPGQYNAFETSLKTLSLNPNVAYKISDQLSVAAGFEAMYMDIKLARSIPPPIGPNVPLTLSGNSWGYGGNFALDWKILPNLGVGLVYRLPVREQNSGSASTPGNSNPLLGTPAQDTDFQGTMVMPASTTLGINYLPISRLNLGTAVTYTEWSSMNKLSPTFSDLIVGGAPLTSSLTTLNWHNTWRFSVGAEYWLTSAWALESSYSYETSPDSRAHANYLLPPGGQNSIGLGTRVKVDAWTFDLSYVVMFITPESFGARPDDGILDTKSENGIVHLFGLSVGRKF